MNRNIDLGIVWLMKFFIIFKIYVLEIDVKLRVVKSVFIFMD